MEPILQHSATANTHYGSLDKSPVKKEPVFRGKRQNWESKEYEICSNEEMNLPKEFGKVKGPPVVVSAQVKISFLEDLDIVSGTFHVKGFIETSWYDKKFFEDHKDKKSGKAKVDFRKTEKEGSVVKYWKPKIKVKNTSKNLMPENYGTTDSWIGDCETGILKMRTSFQGRANSVLDLRKFPFDQHDVIVSLHFMNKDKRIWIVDSSLTKAGKVQVRSQEWELLPFHRNQDIHLERGWSDPNDSTSLNVYPGIRARIRIAREWAYYMYNTVLIVIIITLMTVGAICCPPEDIGDRLNVTLTVTLTTVAIKWTIDGMTPAVPYLTLMDKFLIGQMCIIYVMFVFNCIVAKCFVPNYPESEVERIDNTFAIIWLCTYICMFNILNPNRDSFPSGLAM